MLKLWGFPWKGNSYFPNSGLKYLDDQGRTEIDASSEDIYIDESITSKQPWLGELVEVYGDGIWCSGEQIGFRINKGGINLQYGDTVEVTLIGSSKSVIFREEIKVLSDVP